MLKLTKTADILINYLGYSICEVRDMTPYQMLDGALFLRNRLSTEVIIVCVEEYLHALSKEDYE